MVAINRALARIRDRRDDGGFTLMELIVAIGLLSILMAIVTTAIVSMFQTVRKQQGQADAIDQIRFVVDKLDKSVRYANAINTPAVGATAGITYVEWRAGNLTGATNFDQTCTQWRFDSTTGLLQSRSWIEGQSGTLTAWFTQATGISQNGSNPVFAAPVSSATGAAAQTKQQLQIWFNATNGVQQTTTRTTKVTFTAQNTTSSAVAAGKCIASTTNFANSAAWRP